ncbi:MAG: YlxR family protein [Clostridia bacterium]
MPTRSCIVCRKKDDKEKMLRIILNEEKKPLLDKIQKVNTRGIYLCRDKKCIKKCKDFAQKEKIRLKIPVNNKCLFELLEKIENELEE